MNIIFSDHAWSDYLYWQETDKKVLKSVNKLIKDIMASPTLGVGKPEPLKHILSNCWSRRITVEHRLIYKFDDKNIYILQCRYHY